MTELSIPKNEYRALLRQAERIIDKEGKVYVLYERGRGFLCRRTISQNSEAMINDKAVFIVGSYTFMDKERMIEDFECEIELQVLTGN